MSNWNLKLSVRERTIILVKINMTSFTTKFRDGAYLKHTLTLPNSKRRCSGCSQPIQINPLLFSICKSRRYNWEILAKKFTKYLYILASFKNLQDQNAPKKYLFTFERNSCLIFKTSTLLLIPIACKFRTFRSVCFIEMFTQNIGKWLINCNFVS